MSKQSNELRVLSEGETEISSDDNSKHLFTEFSRCHGSFGWKNIGWRREIIVENVFWSRVIHVFVFVIARRVCTSPCFVFVTTFKVFVEVFWGLAIQQIVVFCDVLAVFANLMRCS